MGLRWFDGVAMGEWEKEMMEQQVLGNLKQRLTEEITNLRSFLADMEERAQTVDLDQPIGRLSRMDSLANQSIAMNTRDKAATRLARLERAMARIDSADFGHCGDCGESIAPARLLAMPEATLCVNCAE